VAWPGSSGTGKGMNLTSGARMSVRGMRGGESGERRNYAEKAYSKECAKGARVAWPGERQQPEGQG
jgi:hypothetical protein